MQQHVYKRKHKELKRLGFVRAGMVRTEIGKVDKMDPYDIRERMRESNRKNRRKKRMKKIISLLLGITLLCGAGFGVFFLMKDSTKKTQQAQAQAKKDVEQVKEQKDKNTQERENCLQEASLLAAMYDYSAAIEKLNSYPEADSYPEFVQARQSYEVSMAACTPADISKIPHIFFHSLIADNSKVFDGDNEEAGYNQYMTTIDEFNRIIEQMYARGYVLVSMHDMAYMGEDGVMHKGEIMLPPGKMPFVLSVDDVNYYNYMLDDGFASRIIIGEDGKPATERDLDNGESEVGDFDVVPLLDKFVEEHPDFSYRGAKGLLGITGYEGVLGYRTCPTDEKNGYDESQIETAKQVAQCLKDDGWEFASHTWGHLHMGASGVDKVKLDADKWEQQVKPILGDVDILIYPYGEDINSFRQYTMDNEKFAYLKQKGFYYYCNVDSNPYWVQMGDDYLRQGRRNLDGYRLYHDYIDESVDKLSDLIDVKTVYDAQVRPPVPDLTGDGK